MLHDDGVIFDDGVLTCIDDNFFLAGPTSGNAEAVASWLEQWRQTEWPDMRVAIAPVTSQWAAVALAGPRSRDLLARLEPDMDISAEALAHMQFCEGRLAGVPARIARVSFTGELQYEISVPARYGADLMRRALNEGAALAPANSAWKLGYACGWRRAICIWAPIPMGAPRRTISAWAESRQKNRSISLANAPFHCPSTVPRIASNWSA